MQRSNTCSVVNIFWAVLVLILISSSPVQAEIDPEKFKNIKKLLAVSGIKEQLSYMKDGVLNSYSQMISASYHKVPDAFWSDFNGLIEEKDMDSLMDQVVPVYDKHMTEEVINNLIAMFETPFWKEWRQKMPAISREAGIAGQQWVQKTTQSETFKKKIDQLVAKHELEKLNPPEKNSK